MALIEIGRVCIKKYGRDAGSRAVVTKVIDKNFVNIITAQRQKERRCNIRHLEFISEKADISNNEQIAKALEIPSLKTAKKQEEKDEKKTKEKKK
ncbi:MAG: 50S ribosomal protein L14e [Candidatus Micrarchaeia archaeon]